MPFRATMLEVGSINCVILRKVIGPILSEMVKMVTTPVAADTAVNGAK